jgi:hypothetical protein
MSQLLRGLRDGLSWPAYSASRPTNQRLLLARFFAVVGVLAGNWWIAMPFLPGMLPSTNAFFSNFEASGQPNADVLQFLDLLGGLLLFVALMLRGPLGPNGGREEWPWLVLYATSGAVGGLFPFACPEGTSATCRVREWTLALPPSHYIHMISGTVEFVAATLAIYLAWRRYQGASGALRPFLTFLLVVLAIGYPVLAVAYLGDRWGAFIEPVFFLSFSAIALFEVFQPDRQALRS